MDGALVEMAMMNSRGQRSEGPAPRGGPVARTTESTAVEAPIVFVIDDDESMRRALDRLLRSVGLQVETFSAASDFIARPLPDRPACVILDLRLPGLSGLEVQESLARAGREIPIIFISGYADVPSSVRALKAGAFDFLQKPFGDQQLLDVIHEALERNRVDRRERAERAAVRERFDTLTPRERDVLRLVLQGLLNKQIAAELGISEKTVKFHRGRVMDKTQAGSVAELVRQAGKIDVRPARPGGPPASERPA
jgi:RNA polymerase sigma factor (sigma-70 family)